MATNRNPNAQTTVHANRVIPYHGDGVSPRITFDAAAEVSKGGASSIFATNVNKGGTIVYSMRREEAAFDILYQIIKEQRTTLPRPKAGGKSKDASNEENIQEVVWDDSALLQEPDFGQGMTSEIVTFTFALSGLEKV